MRRNGLPTLPREAWGRRPGGAEPPRSAPWPRRPPLWRAVNWGFLAWFGLGAAFWALALYGAAALVRDVLR